MKTNSDITVYNKYIDATTRSEKYQRTVVLSVAWENRKGSNALAMGSVIAANQANIYIPLSERVDYLDPIEWLAAKTGKWTLQVGDVIVRGTVTDEISSSFTISDLKAKYNNVLVITSVDYMDAGSLSMHHWKVGAQ